MEIGEYFGTLQESFIIIWRKHLKANKNAVHVTLNEYYDDIVDALDGVIEGYMGLYGKVTNYTNTINGDNYDNPVDYLTELRKFTIAGREELIDNKDTELWGDIDTILSLIDSTLYKLKELTEFKSGSMTHLRDYFLESLK